MFKSRDKDTKDTKDTNAKDSSVDDYRAPSDTGSSNQPDVVAGVGDKSEIGSSGADLSPAPVTAADVEGDDKKRSPREILTTLRAWGKQHRLRGPMDADWEIFEKLVGKDG